MNKTSGQLNTYAYIFYVPKPVIIRTNMSIFFVLLILVWSHMSGKKISH